MALASKYRISFQRVTCFAASRSSCFIVFGGRGKGNEEDVNREVQKETIITATKKLSSLLLTD